MNDLITSNNQTPIEIALGIDENGMTTAKKLYSFLELDEKNYSRWCRTNIVENEFATENEDYEVFVTNEENPLGGRPTQDYKLTAHFAKKLSMKGNGERAEQAREYFATLEEKTKEAVINYQQLSPELRAVIVVDKRVTAVENKITHLENNMNIDYSQQKQLKNFANEVVVNAIGGKESKAYRHKTENGEKISSKCFSRFWHDFNDYFNINAYANLPRVKFQEALEYINKWRLPTNMQLEIERINRMGL